jgi:hypothetical protein
MDGYANHVLHDDGGSFVQWVDDLRPLGYNRQSG